MQFDRIIAILRTVDHIHVNWRLKKLVENPVRKTLRALQRAAVTMDEPSLVSGKFPEPVGEIADTPILYLDESVAIVVGPTWLALLDRDNPESDKTEAPGE